MNYSFQDCDLGQQSILHAVKTRSVALTDKRNLDKVMIEEIAEEPLSMKPFSQTLVDLQLENAERENIADDRIEYSLRWLFSTIILIFFYRTGTNQSTLLCALFAVR